MLVVIVVAAAIAFSLFLASEQAALQKQERNRQLQEAENVTVRSLTGFNSAGTNLTIAVSSSDTNNISITGITVDGDPLNTYCLISEWTVPTPECHVLSTVAPPTSTSGSDGLTVSLSATNKTTVTSTVLQYSISGGVPPYNWTLTRNESSLNLTGGRGGVYYTGDFTYGGTYTYYLNVTDASHNLSTATAVVTVNTKPLCLPVGGSPSCSPIDLSSFSTVEIVTADYYTTFQAKIPIQVDIFTQRASEFVDTFFPPVAEVAVSELTGYPILDGGDSYQPTGSTGVSAYISEWLWNVTNLSGPSGPDCRNYSNQQVELTAPFMHGDDYLISLMVVNTDGLSGTTSVHFLA
jgi:hypothetical protein